jgi:hypothetical protein
MRAHGVLVLLVSLSVPSFWAAPPAVASPQTSRLQQERDVLIAARTRDYEARLKAVYDRKLQEWSASFLERRRNAIQRAGEALAGKAAAIRTARSLTWDEVAQDPEFLAFERQQIRGLLNPQQIRGELVSWARGVEDQTRREMIEFFRQLIAEDLGMVFDQRLRGKVEQAVQAIPLETLVAADTGRIEARIRSALPVSSLTRQQRTMISAAASALAFAAGPALAAAAGVPQFTKEVTTVSMWVAQRVTAQSLEWLDRLSSGEPSPVALSRQIEQGLQDWQAGHLAGRLRDILDQFGQRVLSTLEDEARRSNLQGGGR